jgi:hypothetical protein
MPKPDGDSSKRPAKLLGAYIILAFIAAAVIVALTIAKMGHS